MTILKISENILLLIAGLGILQGVLLAALVYFHRKSDKSVNTFLALYIFFFCIVMTLPFTLKAFAWQHSFIQQPIPLLTGPLLYLYLRSYKEVITWRKALPHLLWYFIFLIPTYLNVTAMAHQYPDAKTIPTEALHRPATILINYAKLGQSVLYFFLSRQTLRSYQRSIRQLFSETSRIDLHWASILVNGYMMIVSTALIVFSLMLRFPSQFNLLLLLNMCIATPYIYLVTYKGVMQPTIWQLHKGTDKHIIEEEIQEAAQRAAQQSNTEKTRSAKPSDKIDEIVTRIIDLMEEDKLYQDTDLTLQHLANKLQAPTYQVSQAINEGMKKNFYDLVNSYRVEEAKRLLLDSKNRNYTILSVGFEAGFNSKTTFNTVFKKLTGFTPTDFRDKHKRQMVPVFSN